MRKLLLVLAVVSAMTAYGQTHDGKIVIGNADSIHSAILKETRHFWVHVPASYASAGKSTRYPVLYLLDGDAHFHSVTGLVHQLASGVNGNILFPEMIVVAILNTDRTRDLTPTKLITNDPQQLLFMGTAGGGENFISFLKNELIPHIENKFNTAPYRVLVGHSLGGLMAIHTLVNHTDLFNAYIAIDPSMWWNKRELLNQLEKNVAAKKFNNRSLYLSIANTLPPGLAENEVDRDTSLSTDHIRSIKKLASILDQHKNNGLQFKWTYYAEDDHGSVPLISEYTGLRFIFHDYRFDPQIAFAHLDSLVKHYELMSKRMGYTISPPENLVNQLGYLHMQSGDIEKAITSFALNIRNFPSSPNVYDSMGDAYSAKGDKQKAKENYEKTLSLDPHFPGTQQKLNDLVKKGTK